MSLQIDYAPGAYALGSAGGDGGGGQPPRKPDDGSGGRGRPFEIQPSSGQKDLQRLFNFLGDLLERPCNRELAQDILAFIRLAVRRGYPLPPQLSMFASSAREFQLIGSDDDGQVVFAPQSSLFRYLYRSRDAQRLSNAASRLAFHQNQCAKTRNPGPFLNYIPAFLQACTRGRLDARLDADSDDDDLACNNCLARGSPCFQFRNPQQLLLHNGVCVPCFAGSLHTTCSFARNSVSETPSKNLARVFNTLDVDTTQFDASTPRTLRSGLTPIDPPTPSRLPQPRRNAPRQQADTNTANASSGHRDLAAQTVATEAQFERSNTLSDSEEAFFSPMSSPLREQRSPTPTIDVNATPTTSSGRITGLLFSLLPRRRQ